MTIDESAQDGCNGIGVKSEVSKTHLKWKYSAFRGSTGLKGLPQMGC